MATSDSEDFESADEWEGEDREHGKDKIPSNTNALKSSIELNYGKTCEKDSLCTEHAEVCDSEVNVIAKDLNRNVSLLDKKCDVTHGQSNTLCPENTKDNANVNDISDDTSNKVKQKEKRSEQFLIPKEVNQGTALEANTVTPIVEKDGWECEDEREIDGWDCEDVEFDEGIIEDDAKGNVESALNRLSDSLEKEPASGRGGGNWGGWGSWGVTSLLSTATESVSSLTNHVSQGLSTVLESGLGVPNPEELVKQEIEEEKKSLTDLEKKSETNEDEKQEDGGIGLFGLGRVMSGVSSITKLVETASTKVVSGGLDTLETIGKKTMEVLQEGDPGLRKKRAIFSGNVVLSQLLREAKEKAEEDDKALKSTQEARKVHFETRFDDHHGLVHLEALEMLSKQCSIKLQSISLNKSSSEIMEYQESLLAIKELCQMSDDEEPEGATFEALKTKLAIVGKGLGVPVANEKISKTWEEIDLWIQQLKSKQLEDTNETFDPAALATSLEIYQKAIDSLARLTAESVEQFHKTAELLLICEKRNPHEEAKILLDMTSTFSLQVSTAATVFSEHLSTSSESEEKLDTINSYITNIFFEAANSSSYIQEAFQLLVPVLQVGVTLP